MFFILFGIDKVERMTTFLNLYVLHAERLFSELDTSMYIVQTVARS